MKYSKNIYYVLGKWTTILLGQTKYFVAPCKYVVLNVKPCVVSFKTTNILEMDVNKNNRKCV